MFLPGLLKELTGTYCASLLMSFGATSLSFLCFIVMYYVHPIGEPPTQKLTADLV